MSILQADLTWTGEKFERNVQVHVENGHITSLTRGGVEPDTRLADRALLPGFVNAHSHAFQRGLRGHGETFPEGSGSFWTWREAMYRLVNELTPESFHDTCVRAFREMRTAGVTTVGEFHYLHHVTDRTDYAFDEIVLDAARAAGLRIVLLNAYYRRGGINEPLAEQQQRFRSESPAEYWMQMDRLLRLCEGEKRWLGAVVHSIRAASLDDLRAVYEESRRRGIVFHMHLEEQPREIHDCVKEYGKTPLEVVQENLDLGESFTAVHCTHSDPEAMRKFRGRGGQVCICPLTEANLGAGLADVEAIGGVCLGTDSNARISMLEEMRWLEYGQRLQRQQRGVLRDANGTIAGSQLRAATEEGARSLGIPAGRIAAGCWADFAAIDLTAPTLMGWTDETLAESLLSGAAEEAIAGTCVAGQWEAP